MADRDQDELDAMAQGLWGFIAGAFIWAVLFWAYFQLSRLLTTGIVSNLMKEAPIFGFVGVSVVFLPLLMGWITLLQCLRYALLPGFTKPDEADSPFAFFPMALIFLLIAIVLRLLLSTINNIAGINA